MGRWVALGMVAVVWLALVATSRCGEPCHPDSACWEDRGLRELERPY